MCFAKGSGERTSETHSGSQRLILFSVSQKACLFSDAYKQNLVVTITGS